jgi:hypothetical protein
MFLEAMAEKYEIPTRREAAHRNTPVIIAMKLKNANKTLAPKSTEHTPHTTL